jgi:hypothetical protein
MLTGSNLPNHDVREHVEGGVRLKAPYVFRERLDGDYGAVWTDSSRQRNRHHPDVRSDIDRGASGTGQSAENPTLHSLLVARRDG